MADLDAYAFERRLLFYYIDAKHHKSKETASRLVAEIKADRDEMITKHSLRARRVHNTALAVQHIVIQAPVKIHCPFQTAEGARRIHDILRVSPLRKPHSFDELALV